MFNRIQNPKTRGLIKLISGIIVLALMLFVFFFDFSKDDIDTIKENMVNFGRCAKEGEQIGTQGMPSRCCSGLKAQGSKPFIEAPGGLSICTK